MAVKSFLRATSWGERVHLLATGFWLLLVPPTILYWRESVEYLVFISVYAVIVGHLSAFQGAKAERNSPNA